LANPNLKCLAVSHRSGDNFAAKRGARVQIPPSPRGRGVAKTLQTETADLVCFQEELLGSR
jgi:hypothetical protein